MSDQIKKLQSTDPPKSGHSLSDTDSVCLFGPSFSMVWQCSHPSFAPHLKVHRSFFLKIRIPSSPGVCDLPQLSKPECSAGRVTHPRSCLAYSKYPLYGDKNRAISLVSQPGPGPINSQQQGAALSPGRRVDHGRITGGSREDHRRIMGGSWQDHGRIMRGSWQEHWKIT